MSTMKNAPGGGPGASSDQLGGGSVVMLPHRSVIAHCRAERARTSTGHYWILTVDRCPLCSGRHTHGGGDQLRPQYGHRTAHCANRQIGSGYWLEPAPEGAA